MLTFAVSTRWEKSQWWLMYVWNTVNPCVVTKLYQYLKIWIFPQVVGLEKWKTSMQTSRKTIRCVKSPFLFIYFLFYLFFIFLDLMKKYNFHIFMMVCSTGLMILKLYPCLILFCVINNFFNLLFRHCLDILGFSQWLASP